MGINLWEKSPRSVRYNQAFELAEEALSLKLKPVAILVQPERKFLQRLLRSHLFSLYQLHRVTFVPDGIEWIRPIPIKNKDDLFPPPTSARYDLFDAAQPGVGGGGKSFPWEFLNNYTFTRPTLVAGGITPENVQLLLKHVRPYGIDVASGVEDAPGIKNPRKIELLCERVIQVLTHEPVRVGEKS